MNKKEESLRQRIVRELRGQGFDVPPQLQLPTDGVWFHGKFYSYDDMDTSRWGYPTRMNCFLKKGQLPTPTRPYCRP